MNSKKMTSTKSFILRVWNEEPDEQKQPKWRYVLLDAETESRQGFTSLDKLFRMLYGEISGDKPTEAVHNRDNHRC